MGLKLYDTMRREKVDFAPIDPASVRMYACGPTVYDNAHIGNGRSFIAFDLLFRLLRHLYGAAHVAYARNITDVEDKINERAARDYPGVPLNEAIRRVTEATNTQFQADIAALGCLPPTVQPRATEHIAEMVAIIERLIANGHAYVAEAHVLFHVPSFADYGRLARRSPDDMLAEARIEVAPYKSDPMDFVLWKPSSAEEPGWDSPWGRGRPGWHIECSAMAWKHLGEVFDIHAGGVELTFPHHENEIAQSRCCFGRPVMANVWLHNGFLQIEGEKMSKSLGNFFTIRELLDTRSLDGRAWDGGVLRFAMLRTHYRQPIDLTAAGLHEAERTLIGFDELIAAHPAWRASEPPPAFVEALCDDLNTPAALAELYPLVRALRSGAAHADAGGQFLAALDLLGLDTSAAARERRARPAGAVDAGRVEALVAERLAARKAKDFAASDRLRDELAAMGVRLKDGRDPATGEPTTTWEVAR